MLEGDVVSELANTIQTVSVSNSNFVSESEIHVAPRRSQEIDMWLKFSESAPMIKVLGLYNEFS